MILVRLMGGMGNQMFQFAAGKALAAVHNSTLKVDIDLLPKNNTKEVRLDYREYQLHLLNFPVEFATETEKENLFFLPSSLLKRIQNKIKSFYFKQRLYIQPFQSFDKTFHQLPDNFCIVGGFQSEKYFKNIENSIRELYNFNHLKFNSNTEALKLKIQNTNAVAIQVRRGDYVTSQHFSNIIGAKDISYFKEGIEIIKQKVQNPEFYIFSDDIEWCQQNLIIDAPTFYLTEENSTSDAVEQMALMSMCKYFIISNSTFAWWGAWLSSFKNKTVVAPKVWTNDPALINEDILPEDWLKI